MPKHDYLVRKILAATCYAALLGACQEAPSQKPAEAARTSADSTAQAESSAQSTTIASADSALAQKGDTPPDNAEYLDWTKTSINGKQPLLGTKTDLFKALGQPDSLVDPDMNDICTSFYSKSFQYAYCRQSEIEVYGDTAVVTSLDFRSSPALALHTAGMTLNRHTTLAALANTFPQAVREQSLMDVYGIGKLTAVKLPISKAASDDAWLLFFDKGKLVRIDYWMPC